MFDVDPEGLEGRVGVVEAVSGNTPLVDYDMHALWWAVDEESESEDGGEDEDAEDNVAEDDCRHSYRNRDDAHRPEPVWTAFLVFVFIGIPFHPKGSLLSHPPNYNTTSKRSGGY